MRIEKDKVFEPVKVVLETQEEVNAFYALINHSSIVQAIPVFEGWWNKLTKFTTPDYQNIHKKLNDSVIKI